MVGSVQSPNYFFSPRDMAEHRFRERLERMMPSRAVPTKFKTYLLQTTSLMGNRGWD